jgi:hypothetical protein
MEINPIYAAVGSFFKRDPIFFVPRYQRSYSWDQLEIDDFIRDLKNCYKNRSIVGKQTNHFFGGIVSVKRDFEGVVDQHDYEIVDGQQRLATFVLLVSGIIEIYEELYKEAGEISDYENENLIKKRIEKLTSRFIEFDIEVHRKIKSQEVITLSKIDEQYFRDVIRYKKPNPLLESHKRILAAFVKIQDTVRELTQTSGSSLSDRSDNLNTIDHILSEDFSLINMVTYSPKEAYRLFQVLNNRGKNLTEGDLLRARTLEKLERYSQIQKSAETLWEGILVGKSEEVSIILNAIFSSHKGNEPGANTLFEEFANLLFPQLSKEDEDFHASDASELENQIRLLNEDVQIARNLLEGQWPFEYKESIVHWDRERFRLLIIELGHTECIPLLLSSYHLGQKRFSEIIQFLEFFIFRYIIVCDLYIGDVVKIYLEEALNMRSTPHGEYQIPNMKNRFRILMEKNCNDETFKSGLNNLYFHNIGKSNKPMKYFLLTLEYYHLWFKNGASLPHINNKEVVFDFYGSNIEHIYSQNTEPKDQNDDMENVKHQLGNLAFMSKSDNSNMGNKSFNEKKIYFKNSQITMNHLIAEKDNWKIAEFNERSILIKDMACCIFQF